MFSYRHAFHAGNHADVLKHAILVHVLDHFGLKPAPYWVIDTHAGAGLYDLRSDWSAQSGECAQGLDRILAVPDRPAFISRYLEEIERLNPEGIANFYPGSPWLAAAALRERDRLRLFELHPTESRLLAHNVQELEPALRRKIQLHHDNGFTGLKSLLPPPSRRAIVLMDPSYEDKTDYRSVLTALRDALTRFPTGCYAIWYPLVQRREVQQLARSLEHLPDTQWVHAALTVRRPAEDGHGLHGSGMFVINPPHTLHAALQTALPWMTQVLAQDDRARYELKTSDDKGRTPGTRPAGQRATRSPAYKKRSPSPR